MRLLISYFHYQDPEVVKELTAAGVKLFVDSGAFGAFKAGTTLDVRAYAEFLKECGPSIDGCFNMDVIGDARASKRNLDLIKSYGINPLPVWQGFAVDDFKGIDAFVDGEDYVAIGGLVKTHNTTRSADFNERRITSFMNAVAGRAKVHLLGYANPPNIKRFKPYSCDASTVARALRYGLDFELWNISTGKKTLLNKQMKGYDMAMMDLLLKITRNPNLDVANPTRRTKIPGELWCPAREITWASYANLSIYVERVMGVKMYLVGCLKDDIHFAKELARRGL